MVENSPPEGSREDIILQLGRDRRLAHATLFEHRHPSKTPEFHYELIDLWHSDRPKVLAMAFRGGAKSTIGEECLIIEACLRAFRNGIILGDSETRAKERLASIKYEFENNEFIQEIFGDLVGQPWGETKIVLSNGVAIQAYGSGQSLRGVKHNTWRPDRVFIDDLEDEESVATPEARDKVLKYLVKVVLPAMNKKTGRIRVNATPLDPEALPMKLKAASDWHTVTYPIKFRDAVTGEWTATWPDHFPLADIEKMEREYAQLGASKEFAQEFMCEAVDPASQVFTADMFRVEPVVRTWEATYAAYDPARTVKNTSAQTGYAVFSWVNNRLIVWEADGHLWKPDEMIASMFDVNERFAPVALGVEDTGLNEFIMQPLRHEQARRNTALPLRALVPPKGKDDFIKGLQPFFKAREVVFVKPMPELQNQLLSFPTGRKDVPNALAYAMKMRPGQVIYEDFGVTHIAEDISVIPNQPCWLAANATGSVTCAVLLQFVEGGVRVVADWVREGDPGSNLAGLWTDACLEAGRKPRVVAGPWHFGNHDTVGLRSAAAKVPLELRRGGTAFSGRDTFRRTLKQLVRGRPAVVVGTGARWTLNALSGGYAREMTRQGVLSDFAKEGAYRVLMEGLESLVALLNTGAVEGHEDIRYDVSPDGRRYVTMRGGAAHAPQETKR